MKKISKVLTAFSGSVFSVADLYWAKLELHGSFRATERETALDDVIWQSAHAS